MEREESPSLLSVAALVLAVLLLILSFGLKYRVFMPKPAKVKPPSPTSVTEPRASPRAVQSRSVGPSFQPEQRELSAEELYRLANPAVVLVEVFDDEGHKRAQGSGFVASENGSVITNYHVMRGAYQATAKFADGTAAPVMGVVGYDQNRDVAVVRIAKSTSVFLRLGDSDRIHVGQRVLAIGSPMGFQNTPSEGIVSGQQRGLIQMSAPISPGSSGGPILNTVGEVIGVAVSTAVGGQNLNFAVPINWAKDYFGSAAPRALSEVAAENTVIEQVVSGSMSIAAGQAQTWQVTVDSDKMSNGEIHGEVYSSGGMDGKITLALFYGIQPIYNCRETYCAIHRDLFQPGVYTLVLDNRMSPLFSRTINAQIGLRYVR